MAVKGLRASAFSLLWRACLTAKRQRRLVVLTFHQVLRQPDPLRPDEISLADFRAAMQLVSSCFNVVSLEEALDELASGGLARGGVAITFDDGYRDNVEVALPVLQKLGVTATFFIATGFLDGGRMWNDSVIESLRIMPGESFYLEGVTPSPMPISNLDERLSAVRHVIASIKHLERPKRQAIVSELSSMAEGPLPAELMMQSGDVKKLASAGMTVGGHTIDHPILSRESHDEAMRQIAEARASLQALSGQAVNLFAYPNGRPDQDYGQREARLVEAAGFRAGLTTSWGSIHAGSDPFQLPRIALWDWRPVNIGLRICQSVYADGEVAAA